MPRPVSRVFAALAPLAFLLPLTLTGCGSDAEDGQVDVEMSQEEAQAEAEAINNEYEGREE